MAPHAMALEPGAPVVCPTCGDARAVDVRVPGAPPWAARPCLCPDCPRCSQCGAFAVVGDAIGEPSCRSCADDLVGPAQMAPAPLPPAEAA